MSDFIEREAAIKLFNFAVLDCLGMEPTIRAGDIIKALESIPAADVRPVVLCRDCYAYRRDKELAEAAYLDPEMYCGLLRCEMGEDSFCSYGKRRRIDRRCTAHGRCLLPSGKTDRYLARPHYLLDLCGRIAFATTRDKEEG